MSECVIWKNNETGSNYLINPERIEYRGVIGNAVILDGVPSNEYDKLNDQVKGEINDIYELENFLVSQGYPYAKAKVLEPYPLIEDKLAYDFDNKTFLNLNQCDTVKAYEWWDGSNWRTVILDECTTETVVNIIEDEFVNLDEWNGRDKVTGGIGLHERIYSINEIDGEYSPLRYLLVKISQWQGFHDSGEVLTLDQVEEYLVEIGRDVNKYMELIKELLPF